MQLAFPLEIGRPRFEDHLAVLAEAGAQQVPLYLMHYDNRPTPMAPGPELDTLSAAIRTQTGRLREKGLASRVWYMDFRLKPADVMGQDRDADTWFAAICELAVEAGVSTIGFFPTNPGRRETDGKWDERQVAGYQAMADIAADQGLEIASHINMVSDSRFDQADDVSGWFERVDRSNAGLLFCFGCVGLAGLNLSTQIRTWREHIKVVHLRDIAGTWREGNSERRFGEGRLDLPAAIDALHEIGYRGILHPEHFPVSVAELPVAERTLFAHPWDRGLLATTWSLGYWRGMLAGLNHGVSVAHSVQALSQV